MFLFCIQRTDFPVKNMLLILSTLSATTPQAALLVTYR